MLEYLGNKEIAAMIELLFVYEHEVFAVVSNALALRLYVSFVLKPLSMTFRSLNFQLSAQGNNKMTKEMPIVSRDEVDKELLFATEHDLN